MPVSKVDICNLALGKLGQSITISSLSPTESKASRFFGQVFDRVRDFVLADHVWPFTIKHVALALDAEAVLGWEYRYAYPDDCLNALAVCGEDGVRNATSIVSSPQFEPGVTVVDGSYDFTILHGEQATSIATDLEEAYLIYACRVENVARYSPHLVETLACRLAIEAAPVLAAEIGMRMGRQLGDNYTAAKDAAAVQAGNESRAELQPPTPSLASRR